MTIKLKRQFLILIFLCLLNNITIAQTVVTQIPDRLAPANSVLMTGFIAEKLDEAYNNRILTQDVDRLIEPFKNRTEDKCWQSKFWGKWFTSAVQAYKYKPEPELKKRLDIAVLKLLSTQTPDGYIGNYAEDKHLEQWDIGEENIACLGYCLITTLQKMLKACLQPVKLLII